MKSPTSSTENPTTFFNGSITTAVSEIYQVIYCNTSALCQGTTSIHDNANTQFIIQSPGTMRVRCANAQKCLFLIRRMPSSSGTIIEEFDIRKDVISVVHFPWIKQMEDLSFSTNPEIIVLDANQIVVFPHLSKKMQFTEKNFLFFSPSMKNNQQTSGDSSSYTFQFVAIGAVVTFFTCIGVFLDYVHRKRELKQKEEEEEKLKVEEDDDDNDEVEEDSFREKDQSDSDEDENKNKFDNYGNSGITFDDSEERAKIREVHCEDYRGNSNSTYEDAHYETEIGFDNYNNKFLENSNLQYTYPGDYNYYDGGFGAGSLAFPYNYSLNYDYSIRNTHFQPPYSLNYSPTDYESNGNYTNYYNCYDNNSDLQQFSYQEGDYVDPREDVDSFMKLIPEWWNSDQGVLDNGENEEEDHESWDLRNLSDEESGHAGDI
jgi:hypothetical protein